MEQGGTVDITAWGLGLPKAEAAGKIDFYCVFGPTEAYPKEEEGGT